MYFFSVDGSVRFPTVEGPASWRAARVTSWRGKGKVTVDQVLGWIAKDTLVDASAPRKFQTAYFFDVTAKGSSLTLRGFCHRDDQEMILALLEVAAELGAEGKVLFDIDPLSGIHAELAKGKLKAKEVAGAKMPPGVVEAIERESDARGRRLGRAKAAPAAKAPAAKAKKKTTTETKKKTAAKKR